MAAISIPEIISPIPKPSFNPIFLPGSLRSNNTSKAASRVPSRLPSPAPSDSSIPNSPDLPCVLPPSPTASPTPIELPERKEALKPTLLTLPTEILRHILCLCSAQNPNKFRLAHDEVYADRIRRNIPDLPAPTARALYSTCRTLRSILLDFECQGTRLGIRDIGGTRHWRITPPIWAYSKDIALRWDDSGTLGWPLGVEEEQWAIIKARSDAKYGPRKPQKEAPQPRPKRADQINMTGEKPKDPKAYWAACRAYLERPPPPPREPKPHRPEIAEDLAAVLGGCEVLRVLKLNFPGALEAFAEAVMALPEDARVWGTVKELHLRNGNEMCFPPPRNLFLAIGRLRGLEKLQVEGNCSGMDHLFSAKERKKRGVYVAEDEGSPISRSTVRSLWGWECTALEIPMKPPGLKICKVTGMPGLAAAPGGKSDGVWNWRGDDWPGELREKLSLGLLATTERGTGTDRAHTVVFDELRL